MDAMERNVGFREGQRHGRQISNRTWSVDSFLGSLAGEDVLRDCETYWNWELARSNRSRQAGLSLTPEGYSLTPEGYSPTSGLESA